MPSSSIFHLQVIPPALLCIVPLYSVFLISLSNSRHGPITLPKSVTGYSSENTRFWSLFAILCLAIVSVLDGSLGLAVVAQQTRGLGSNTGEIVVALLLRLLTSLSVIYLCMPYNPVSLQLRLFNISLLFVLLCVTFVSLLAIFLPVTHLLAPLLNLLATILLLPLPVFRIFSSPAAIAIPVRQTNLNSLEKALSVQDSDADFGAHNHAQSRGLSIILSLAQFSAFIASIFAILVVREDDTPHTQGSIARSVAFKILGAIFMFLSLVGITTSFYLRSSIPTTQPKRPNTRSGSSLTHNTSISSSSSGDFLNLRDPFASPPPPPPSPSTYSHTRIIPQSFSALDYEVLGAYRESRHAEGVELGLDNGVGGTGTSTRDKSRVFIMGPPPPPFAKKKKRSNKNSTVNRQAKKKGSSQALIPPSPPISPSSPIFPLHPPPISPEDLEFDHEEAILSQMLLRTLDSLDRETLAGGAVYANGENGGRDRNRERFTVDSASSGSTLCVVSAGNGEKDGEDSAEASEK